MVFIVIPPSDVDVGSPIDEKLTTTIKTDLDDLDARTTTNTTDIAALAGGGGGGGGGAFTYGNTISMDTPGTWTSPATIPADSYIYIAGAAGGGGGGTIGGSAGGTGGTSTATTFSTYSFVAKAGGGAGAPGTASIPSTSSTSNDRMTFYDGNFYHGAATEKIYNPGSKNIRGGSYGGELGLGAAPGGNGGGSLAVNGKIIFAASTVYPVTIGQAGAGGGGGWWPSAPAGTSGGAGGGPGGGAGATPAGGGAPGGPGGIVPHSFLSSVGSKGGDNVPFPNGSTGGGGGSGVHGFLFIFYNN